MFILEAIAIIITVIVILAAGSWLYEKRRFHKEEKNRKVKYQADKK